ncbi:MAG TPA: hypothetical protein PKY86_01665 [Niabella sp.]|nr:hypothetical protein [Niabella sp.]HQW14261.1 hypothetical protein [Niabella sp.]HQX19661.1 hypothetical protein [Niabella sp.]HQX39905.1 hypothetical protein [Niabella sp.]HRB06898.1 hypothetical protein [Niabella sp.]
MKLHLMLLFSMTTILSFAQKTEEATIKKLIDDESSFAAKADFTKWASCWVNSDEASFSFTNKEATHFMKGFNAISKMMENMKPFELKLSRNNYQFTLGKDLAFVIFDQQDNWGGTDRVKKESRTLRKLNGKWKILNVSVVEVSSFANPETASFHSPVDKIPQNPKNGFTNIYGLGGMSISYMNIPGPADFTPMFEGLPGNMCNSPHWGYMLEGSVKIQYPGGKEETVHAGEVFYWPAPHTGVIEKSAKFIDFSPDGKFIQVIEHVGKKMAAAKSK